MQEMVIILEHKGERGLSMRFHYLVWDIVQKENKRKRQTEDKSRL